MTQQKPLDAHFWQRVADAKLILRGAIGEAVEELRQQLIAIGRDYGLSIEEMTSRQLISPDKQQAPQPAGTRKGARRGQ